MSRKLVVSLPFLLFALCVLVQAQSQTPRLNVLFVIADDLNNELGTYGSAVRTPNIDRLAARGVRFDRAYNQFPLCNPSRSSFLTGQRPNVTGVVSNEGNHHFREKLPSVVTLPQAFRRDGWVTARVGKLFHYGVPGEIGTSGLDDNRSWDFTVNPRGRDRDGEHRIFSLLPGQFGRTLSWLADEGPHSEQTDAIGAQDAVRLLELFKRDNRPFFLGVGFYRPHTPYVAPKCTSISIRARRSSCRASLMTIARGDRRRPISSPTKKKLL